MAYSVTRCSRCGGEKDAEGWCANYCLDDGESEANCLLCHDRGLRDCPDCGGSGKDQDESCATCGGYCKVSCTHHGEESAYYL